MSSSKQRCSSLLPFELVEEILHRIPIESLERFRYICKEWYALLNDKRFIYKYLDLSQERFIRGADKSIQLVNPETQALTYLQIPDEFHSRFCWTTNHCDGLFLCDYTGERGRKLAVWNPILRRVIWIKPSNSYTDHDVYGIGYDNVSRENYKILRFNDEFGKSSEVEIYEFKSKRWRNVDATETPESYRSSKAVSMNGNMYWVVHHKNKMDHSKTKTFIQSYDFSTETFKCICLVPYPLCETFDPIMSGFGGDRLSLLHEHKHVKIEVWVTNKVTDPVVSWSKLFDVPILKHYFLPRGACFIHKSNKIMLWSVEVRDKEKCTRVYIYEMGEGQMKKQFEVTSRGKWYDPSFIFYCNVYVPSLVPVPE